MKITRIEYKNLPDEKYLKDLKKNHFKLFKIVLSLFESENFEIFKRKLGSIPNDQYPSKEEFKFINENYLKIHNSVRGFPDPEKPEIKPKRPSPN